MEQFEHFDPNSQRIREDSQTGRWRIEGRNKPVEWLRGFFHSISLGFLPAIFDSIFGERIGGRAYFDKVIEVDNDNEDAPFAMHLFTHAMNIHDFLPADVAVREYAVRKTCQVLERYKPLLFTKKRSRINGWLGEDDMRIPHKWQKASGEVRGLGTFIGSWLMHDYIQLKHFDELIRGLMAKIMPAAPPPVLG